jgi:ribonuclease R
MADKIDKEQVLSFFREKTRKPLTFREIVYLMGLGPSGTRTLKKVLRALQKEGDVVLTRKGRYGPAEDMSLATGFFEAHADGYGFVLSEKPGERDIFIPAAATLSAMDNDRVIARVENRKRRKGRIIRIIERAHTRVAGTVDLVGGMCYVRPKMRSINFDIIIPPKQRLGAKKGDTVVVEITEYPTGKRPATGRVAKVIGRPRDPKAEVAAIIEEFSLPTRFPRDVHAEAALQRDRDFGERKDLTGLPTVTIDGERARDFDDAVSIKEDSRGYTLFVHIADVGFYVGWDTPLDLEARKRGTSVYFPDRVIPMLPKDLSEDLCSLKPDEQRPAITVQMRFDRAGNRLSARFYPSLIRSDERMTYTSVRKILADGDVRERRKYGRFLSELELMGELAGILRDKRLGRGSLDFDLPEPEVLLDVQGRPEAILAAERNLAHMMIEDFMIAANEAVAEHLEGKGVPSIYRIHEEPDPSKVRDVMRLLRVPVKKAGKAASRMFHKLLNEVKGRPEEETLTYGILRAMKQARYSTENAGHFGLASVCYTHFTSPIRRYPDLVVHRILREALLRKRLPEGRIRELRGILPDMASHSSRKERVADEAEREAVNAMRLWFMKDRVGEEFGGKVVGVTPYGIRVRLKEFYVEGFLHVSSLVDDYYQYNEWSMTLGGRNTGAAYRMGQELTVRLDKVNLEDRELLFGLVGLKAGA